MLIKRCLAFLCAVVLLAAVLVAPVSAASASGETSGGYAGDLNATADLTVYRTAGSASTGPIVTPSPEPYTTITIRCYSSMTGVTTSVHATGTFSTYAYVPDSSYYVVGTVVSNHTVESDAWGRWYTSLSEIADF